MDFEWDPAKAATNLEKHGVSFDEAQTAFADPHGAYYPDALYEDRFILIGYSSGNRILYVVYAEVAGDSIRIISARRQPGVKKDTTKTTDPLDAEIDFTRFGPVRRNAFAGAGEEDGPSAAALWEMPELTTDAVLLRRGRPGKGISRKTVVRWVRLPEAIWEELEEKARARNLNLNQAMRAALLSWLRRTG